MDVGNRCYEQGQRYFWQYVVCVRSSTKKVASLMSNTQPIHYPTLYEDKQRNVTKQTSPDPNFHSPLLDI